MLPDRLILIGQKLVENAKIQMRHFQQFSNNVNAFFTNAASIISSLQLGLKNSTHPTTFSWQFALINQRGETAFKLFEARRGSSAEGTLL